MGAEALLDLASRLRVNIEEEPVQDPEVTANVATHNLVQVFNFLYYYTSHNTNFQQTMTLDN